MTFYAPLDFSWAARRAVARVRPTVLALVELELWPNLVRASKQAGARVAIVNGRLSVRSHRGYRRLRGPLGPTLRRLDAVAAQTEEYAARFVDLGVPRDRVRVTGSVKYDGLESDRNNPEDARLAAEPGTLGGRGRVRGRQHDGGRGGRRPGGLPRGAGRAPGLEADRRPPARRAVRGGGGPAPAGGGDGRPPERAGRRRPSRVGRATRR